MKFGQIAPLFLGLTVFGAVFGYFEVHGLYALILQHRAESFPSTKGKILYREVQKIQTGKHPFWHPLFWYSYQVNGQNYTNSRYRYGSFFGDRTRAEEIVKEHPVDSEIAVYYNPNDPSDAILSPQVEGSDIGGMLMGFPFCIATLFWMATLLRDATPPRPTAKGVKPTPGRKKKQVQSPYQPLPVSLVTAGILLFFAGAVIMLIPSAGLSDGIIVVLVISFVAGAVYFCRYKSLSDSNDTLEKKRVAQMK